MKIDHDAPRAAMAPARRVARASVRPGFPWIVAWLSFLLLPVAASTARLEAQAASAATTAYAFENVTVVPLDGERTLPDHTVVVREGRIESMGPSGSVEVPPGAVRIEGRGRFLMPGLADMHARLPAESDPLRVVVLDEYLSLYLANGVTTIRSTSGAPYQLQLRDAIARGDVVGPRLLVGSPALTSSSAPDPAAAEALVRAHAAAGYDFLTIDSSLAAAAWTRAVEVAREVGLSYAGTPPDAIGLQAAIEAGISTVDDLHGFLEATRSAGLRDDAAPLARFRATDRQRLDELARLSADAGVFLVPAQYHRNQLFGWNHVLGGLAVPDTAVALEDLRYVPQTHRNTWTATARNLWIPPDVTAESAEAYSQWRRDLLATLHSAGARILLGTGATDFFTVPGFSVHRELLLFQEAGMTPYEALETATGNAAEFVADSMERPAGFGRVAPGEAADLLLLGANPLESLEALRSPAGVMAAGNWLRAEMLAERLAAIAERHKDYDID